MSKAKITLIGMSNFLTAQNTDLFSSLSLPDGINKGEFKNSLLLRAGEQEVLYADPNFFMSAVGIWGKKWYRTFKKWIDALNMPPLKIMTAEKIGRKPKQLTRQLMVTKNQHYLKILTTAEKKTESKTQPKMLNLNLI